MIDESLAESGRAIARFHRYVEAGGDDVFVWPISDPLGHLALFGRVVVPRTFTAVACPGPSAWSDERDRQRIEPVSWYR